MRNNGKLQSAAAAVLRVAVIGMPSLVQPLQQVAAWFREFEFREHIAARLQLLNLCCRPLRFV
jgi:hypothetical protein